MLYYLRLYPSRLDSNADLEEADSHVVTAFASGT